MVTVSSFYWFQTIIEHDICRLSENKILRLCKCILLKYLTLPLI